MWLNFIGKIVNNRNIYLKGKSYVDKGIYFIEDCGYEGINSKYL